MTEFESVRYSCVAVKYSGGKFSITYVEKTGAGTAMLDG